jgi:hypothetical protein
MEMENTFDLHISQIMKFFHLTLFWNFLGQIVVYQGKCYPHGFCPIMQLQKNYAKSLNNYQPTLQTFIHFQ